MRWPLSRSPRVLVPLALVVLVAAACGRDVLVPEVSPLSGLVRVFNEDSTGSPVEPPEGAPGSGYFGGIVRGPSPTNATGDTLGTAPRIANVVVRAYPVIGGTSGALELGPEVGSTVTDANGAFTSPLLSGGDYAVTFSPPPGSGYTATYTLAHVDAQSHTYPWWVTLPRN